MTLTGRVMTSMALMAIAAIPLLCAEGNQPDEAMREAVRVSFQRFYQPWLAADYDRASESFGAQCDLRSPEKLKAHATRLFDRAKALRIVSFRERTGQWSAWPQYYEVRETVSFLVPDVRVGSQHRVIVLRETFRLAWSKDSNHAWVVSVVSEDMTERFLAEHRKVLQAKQAIADDDAMAEDKRARALFDLTLELFYMGEYEKAWPFLAKLDKLGLQTRDQKSHDALWEYVKQARPYVAIPDEHVPMVSKYLGNR